MSRKTPVTLAAGGKNEHVVPAGQIIIPDLWGVARAVQSGKVLGSREQMADLIKQVWHLAHDLHNHALHQIDLTPAEILSTAGRDEE